MYITTTWFLSSNGFKYPNVDQYETTSIDYAISIAEEWINSVITAGLIENDIEKKEPDLKIVEGLITAYDETNSYQVKKARDIRQALGRSTSFVLETDFNFITGTFSTGVGDRNINETIDFESSKNSCEDYVKALLAKYYDVRIITQSSAVQFEQPDYDGGLIYGDDRPITWAEALKTFKQLFQDQIRAESPIKLKNLVPNDSNSPIVIYCDECTGAIKDLQEEFLRIWDNTKSDLEITAGSLVGKIKDDKLKQFIQDNIKAANDSILINPTAKGIEISVINDVFWKKTSQDKTLTLSDEFDNLDMTSKSITNILGLTLFINNGNNFDIFNKDNNSIVLQWGSKGLNAYNSKRGKNFIETITNENETVTNLKNENYQNIISVDHVNGKVNADWDSVKEIPFDKENKIIKQNYYAIDSYIRSGLEWVMVYGTNGYSPETNPSSPAYEKTTPRTVVLGGRQGQAAGDTMIYGKDITLALDSTDIAADENNSFIKLYHAPANVIDPNNFANYRAINGKDIKAILSSDKYSNIPYLKDVLKVTRNSDDTSTTGLQILSNLRKDDDPTKDVVPIFQISKDNGQITIFHVYGTYKDNYKPIFQTYPQDNSSWAFATDTNPYGLYFNRTTGKFYYGNNDSDPSKEVARVGQLNSYVEKSDLKQYLSKMQSPQKTSITIDVVPLNSGNGTITAGFDKEKKEYYARIDKTNLQNIFIQSWNPAVHQDGGMKLANKMDQGTYLVRYNFDEVNKTNSNDYIQYEFSYSGKGEKLLTSIVDFWPTQQNRMYNLNLLVNENGVEFKSPTGFVRGNVLAIFKRTW